MTPKAPSRSSGSAAMQAELWGERAEDWADVMEGPSGWGIPLYEHVLDRAAGGEPLSILDIGCGSGRFCRIAADRGAKVAGLDATDAFVAIARERVPEGDVRVGEMEELPWEEDRFDLVTGFNSFFIAADMVNALREARRVARPGAVVAMTVFGRPDHCESTAVFRALGPLMPAAPDAAEKPDQHRDKPRPLHEPGALEELVTEAGLSPAESDYLEFVEDYPDVETALRGMLAAPPFRRVARMAGEDEVRAAAAEALSDFEGPDGRCCLHEEARCLIATA